ncbi:hypothetical protein KR222_000436, partial [Zaprionus bogoriensis]
ANIKLIEKAVEKATTIPVALGPEFQKIGTKFYYIAHDEGLKWSDAAEKCKKMGAHLAVFENKHEFDAVNEKLKLLSSYWIGLFETDTEGEFVSVVDRRPGRYFNWMEGEPNNLPPGHQCVQIRKYIHQMNDICCCKKLGYICEKD